MARAGAGLLGAKLGAKLALVVACALSASVLHQAAAAAQQHVQLQAGSGKPHILLILADDYGWADVGYHATAPGYPSSPKQRNETRSATPHIDKLVKQGIELDQAYVFKYCSPTRCALQSGRNPVHVNVMNLDPVNHNPADPVGGFSAIPRNMTGMANVLKAAGYATAMAGKWDAGMATSDHTPRGRGYDQSLSYFHHANDYWTYQTGHCANQSIKLPITDLWEAHLGGGEGAAHARVRGAPLTCPYYQDANRSDCVYEDALFTRYVLEVIGQHAEVQGTSTPLFFFWAPHLVHSPLEVPATYLRAFDWTGGRAAGAQAWNRQQYMAMVSYLDASIASVTALLTEKNMFDDTLIVFSADNGGPIYWSGVGGANNWPLKGGKGSNWQGGVRVNAWVSGGFVPHKQRGKKLDGLVAIWDWYGTFAALAGVQDYSDKRAAAAGLPGLDSLALWPYLSGQALASPRTSVLLGSCYDSDHGGDQFCGTRGKSNKEGGNTTVQGIIVDERPSGGGLWKLLGDNVWQAGWTGPEFPNNTAGPDGKVPDFNDLTLNCSATVGGGCLFRIDLDPTEHHELSADQPTKRKALQSLIDAAQRKVFSPDRGAVDPGACAAATSEKGYGGFWGPWIE